jgi:Zn-dependent protease
LNPLRHIDPIGTVLVPLLILLIGVWTGVSPILFGWAKPVPVNFGQLRSPKRDMLWVAAAGPGANLVMLLFWVLVQKVSVNLPASYFSVPLVGMSEIGIWINAVLMLVNLLPLPPLDGGRIAVSLLPGRLAWHFARLEPYGLIILNVLVLSVMLGLIRMPVIPYAMKMLSLLFNLS